MKTLKSTEKFELSKGSLIRRQKIGVNIELSLLVLPALVFFIVFHYLPMFGIVIAFKDYNYAAGILGSEWSGLKNFEFFFTSQDAFRIIRNTVLYNLCFIVLAAVLGILMAILLFEVKKKICIKFYQTSMIIPNFVSWVLVGYITYTLLHPGNGLLNKMIQAFGAKPIQWYNETKYWPAIIIICNVWKSIGMGSLMYYASLIGLDVSLFEAADIDGANKIQKAWYISVPSLVNMAVIMTILNVGHMFKGDFGLFYQIPRDIGSLYPVTDVIDTYVYRGLRTGDIGMTSAVGFVQSVVGFVLVILVNGIVRKINPESSLF